MSERVETKSQFKSFDGTELTYRSWSPAKNSDKKKALIIIHRGHEHSGRLSLIIEGIKADDCWAFGYDSRGHGESPGERGYAPSFGHVVKDLDSFTKYISFKYDIPITEMIIVANSVGAVIASNWVHDYAPPIKGMILAAPAFNIKLYIPFAIPALRVLNMFKKPAFISSYVKSKFLTHDKEQQKLYDSDKLITPQIAVNILLELYDASKRVVKDANAIYIPTLILSATKDYIVSNEEQETFYKNLSSHNKRFVKLEGFYHGVLYEKDRAKALGECSEFIDECYNGYKKIETLSNAHIDGYTKREYEDLIHYHRPLHMELFYWSQRFSMKFLGWMSKGIRIGLKHGFDSGLSLDYIYKNKATGFTPIGKIIDYFYINSVGWKGIRQRKINIQSSIETLIKQLLDEGKPVRIIDIASGPARYLIETAKKYERFDLKVILRDHDINNIREGEKIAEELNCKNVEFSLSDAFDPESYTKHNFRPNIVVISGLFELFPDNDLIRKSLKGLKTIMADDAYTVYTGQPWHPQLELISQTLPNRDGKKWIMRRRTQKEIDDIFIGFGARKINMEIDSWGIFTVSTAKRYSGHELKQAS